MQIHWPRRSELGSLNCLNSDELHDWHVVDEEFKQVRQELWHERHTIFTPSSYFLTGHTHFEVELSICRRLVSQVRQFVESKG